ncbi:MAG: hypothetical protein GY781_05230, partial [Gammaproteobacteria bacterium]|nr:hypothetical protein [Gammaproteobacteria bacterium]
MNKEFSIGYWRVDPTQGLLQGEQHSKTLEPKAMELLIVLTKAEGKLVSREEIIKAVWPDQVISDYALNTLIANLRKNLADHDNPPEYIQTRPKLGYNLAVKVVWHTKSADIENSSTAINPDNTELNNASVSAGIRPKSRFSRFLALAISLVSLAAVAIKFFPVAPSSTPSSSLITNPSIAVLPFDVFDGEADTGYFADGLAEEIIHQLAAVPELNVISRTASFSFRGKQANVDEIAQKLKVDYLVEGSVRSDAQSMRITVQLIKTADASHQWSKVFSAAGD